MLTKWSPNLPMSLEANTSILPFDTTHVLVEGYLYISLSMIMREDKVGANLAVFGLNLPTEETTVINWVEILV